jgi:hypothetical protein
VDSVRCWSVHRLLLFYKREAAARWVSYPARVLLICSALW